MKKFQIHDTTLRDGEQMPGVVFSYDEKLMLAKSSIEFGTDFIDIMPSVSEMEEKLTADLASRHKKNISATCRMKKEEIDAAARCGVKQIVLFAALSDIHLIHKRRITRQENLEQSLSMIRYAKDCGLVVDFAGEDSQTNSAENVRKFTSGNRRGARTAPGPTVRNAPWPAT